MNQQSVAVNGLKLHYRVDGEGPDVVFVHGWAASSRMWDHVTARLGGRFRCWQLDLPGCGDSDKPADGWYSIPNFSDTVRAFIAEHGLGPVRLVGHSMGGMIVLDFAARYPEVVERLAAINPVVTGRAHLRRLAQRVYSHRVLHWAVRLSPKVVVPLLAHPWWDRVSGVDYLRRRTEDFAKGTADSLLGSGRAVVGFDVSPVLHQIAAPTLVLVGTLDLNVPVSEGRLAAERIPSARLHTMRAGHMLTDDRPGEVVHHLERFLA